VDVPKAKKDLEFLLESSQEGAKQAKQYIGLSGRARQAVTTFEKMIPPLERAVAALDISIKKAYKLRHALVFVAMNAVTTDIPAQERTTTYQQQTAEAAPNFNVAILLSTPKWVLEECALQDSYSVDLADGAATTTKKAATCDFFGTIKVALVPKAGIKKKDQHPNVIHGTIFTAGAAAAVQVLITKTVLAIEHVAIGLTAQG
jgi:hypothetical protein